MADLAPLGPGDARARLRVLLRRPGRPDALVTLVHYPIPVEQREQRTPRKPGAKKSATAGAKATVILPMGSRISVDPSHLYRLEDPS